MKLKTIYWALKKGKGLYFAYQGYRFHFHFGSSLKQAQKKFQK